MNKTVRQLLDEEPYRVRNAIKSVLGIDVDKEPVLVRPPYLHEILQVQNVGPTAARAVIQALFGYGIGVVYHKSYDVPRHLKRQIRQPRVLCNLIDELRQQ